MNTLNQSEYQRYARHLVLPDVGEAGQLKLKNAKVLVVGAGGLGSPVLLYLAAAGVGKLGIVEFDQVDLSNLQRQIIHSNEKVGSAKLESAQERLQGLNPDIEIIPHNCRLDSTNAQPIVNDYDVVIDATDNFSTRYLINDACFFAKKALVSGSIYSFEGQLAVFNYQESACYRCLYPSPPPPEAAPNCSEAGVLGVLPGVLGCLQAMEAIKIILNLGEICHQHLLYYDALSLSFQKLGIQKNHDCALCGKNPTITKLAEIPLICQNNTNEISIADFLKIRDQACLVDVRENFEREICLIENSIHIPLDQINSKASELPETKEIIFYCKSGARSLKAVEFLRQQSRKSRSLQGGILAWIKEVEPQLKPY